METRDIKGGKDTKQLANDDKVSNQNFLTPTTAAGTSLFSPINQSSSLASTSSSSLKMHQMKGNSKKRRLLMKGRKTSNKKQKLEKIGRQIIQRYKRWRHKANIGRYLYRPGYLKRLQEKSLIIEQQRLRIAVECTSSSSITETPSAANLTLESDKEKGSVASGSGTTFASGEMETDQAPSTCTKNDSESEILTTNNETGVVVGEWSLSRFLARINSSQTSCETASKTISQEHVAEAKIEPESSPLSDIIDVEDITIPDVIQVLTPMEHARKEKDSTE